MIVGTSKIRAHVRATASWPIFDTEYGGDIDELTSPSGSVSLNTCSGSSTGLYTECVDITRIALAVRQWAMSRPVASALLRIAWS